jgi:uncharacterized protein (TIRG00374 family)
LEILRSIWQRIRTLVPGWVWTVVKGLVSAGLVIWLILGFNWNEVFTTLATISFSFILAWFAIWFLGFCFMALRLQLLLSVQKIHIPFRYSLRLAFIGGFMGNFLPSSMGGDAFKFAFLARAGYSKSVTGVSVILDRLFNIAATFLFLPFILAAPGLFNLDIQLQHVLPYYIVGVFLLMVILIVGFVLIGRKIRQHPPLPADDRSLRARLHHIGYRLAFIMGNWLDHPWILVAAMILALLATVCCFSAGWILARGLGMQLALMTWFAIQASLSVLVFLPISFNGLGLQEVSMVYLMTNIGMSEGQSLALALLIRVLVVLISLIGAYGLIVENRVAPEKITNHS